MRDRWLFKPTFTNLLTLFIGVAMNVIGKIITTTFAIPFWLDSFGTIFSACSCGPLAGAIVSVLSSIITAFGDIVNLPYIVVNVLLAIIAGMMFPKNYDTFQIVFTSAILGIIAAIASTPLNILFYSGYTGNKWGDALFDMLSQQNISLTVKCFLSEAFIDIPDKALTLLAVSQILRHKKILFKKNEQEEGMNDEK